MAWDSSRPVPWQRLMREWVIYVGIMAIVFAVFFSDNGLVGAFAGLLISGPLYLAFGYVLAKFGFQRKSFRELREVSAAKAAADRERESTSTSSTVTSRSRPAPTRRTSTGRGRPGTKKNRR